MIDLAPPPSVICTIESMLSDEWIRYGPAGFTIFSFVVSPLSAVSREYIPLHLHGLLDLLSSLLTWVSWYFNGEVWHAHSIDQDRGSEFTLAPPLLLRNRKDLSAEFRDDIRGDGPSGLGVSVGVSHCVSYDGVIWWSCSTATKAAAMITERSTISSDVMTDPQSRSIPTTAGPVIAMLTRATGRVRERS